MAEDNNSNVVGYIDCANVRIIYYHLSEKQPTFGQSANIRERTEQELKLAFEDLDAQSPDVGRKTVPVGQFVRFGHTIPCVWDHGILQTPPGWRMLQPLEQVKEGDRFFNGKFDWISVSICVGKFAEELKFAVIRKNLHS